VKALGIALSFALVASLGCKAKENQRKPPPKAPSAMTDIEVKRGEDACKTYVDKVCACATSKPDLAKQCELAKALPQAMQISLATAMNPDSKPDIVEQSYDSAKKVVAECIQDTAQLPSQGCN
jgi:hypothetical protein